MSAYRLIRPQTKTEYVTETRMTYTNDTNGTLIVGNDVIAAMATAFYSVLFDSVASSLGFDSAFKLHKPLCIVQPFRM